MALVADTQVPTSSEWVRLDMLDKEHIVFDQHGEPIDIKTLQHYTPTECYEVEFDDGLIIQGDKNLTLMMQDKKWRDRLGESMRLKDRKMYRGMRRPLVELTVEELYTNGIHHKDGRLNYSVPNCLPVQYGHKDLPVPPYIFGIWFATMSPTGRHWLRDRPLDKMQRIFRTYGHFIKTRKHKNGDVLFDIRPSVRDSFLFAGVNIPTCLPFYYLDGDVDQRKELLQGLIDGGFIKKSKTTNLYTAKNANYKLMRKIQGLVESFGIKTVLHTPDKTMYYTLKFRTFQDFAQLNGNFSIIYGVNRRFVTKITKIPPKPCVHLDTGTQFLVGEGFISVC